MNPIINITILRNQRLINSGSVLSNTSGMAQKQIVGIAENRSYRTQPARKPIKHPPLISPLKKISESLEEDFSRSFYK